MFFMNFAAALGIVAESPPLAEFGFYSECFNVVSQGRPCSKKPVCQPGRPDPRNLGGKAQNLPLIMLKDNY